MSVPRIGRTVWAPACLLTAARIGDFLFCKLVCIYTFACARTHLVICSRLGGGIFPPMMMLSTTGAARAMMGFLYALMHSHAHVL